MESPIGKARKWLDFHNLTGEVEASNLTVGGVNILTTGATVGELEDLEALGFSVVGVTCAGGKLQIITRYE